MGALKGFDTLRIPADATLLTLIDWCRTVQDRLSAAITSLTKVPTLDGVLLERVTLRAGAVTPVGHGMGRAWRGFHVTRLRADVRVWDDINQPTPERVIHLASSVDCTIDLWVF